MGKRKTAGEEPAVFLVGTFSGVGGFCRDWFGEPAVLGDPVVGGDGAERRDGGEQGDERDTEFPAQGDGGGDGGEGVGDEGGAVDGAKEFDSR